MVSLCLIVCAPLAKARNVSRKASSTSCCAEDIAANREDHRTMTLDQNPESVQVIRGDETFEKLSLRQCSTLLGPSKLTRSPPC